MIDERDEDVLKALANDSGIVLSLSAAFPGWLSGQTLTRAISSSYMAACFRPLPHLNSTVRRKLLSATPSRPRKAP